MKQPASGFLIVLCVYGMALFFAPSSWAQSRSASGSSANQFYLEETFFPVYVSKNDDINPAGGSPDKAVPTESGIGFDTLTSAGYIWSNVLFGLTYNMYQLNTSRSRTADYEGVSRKTSRQAWGPMLGYFLGSWRFALTYFITATKNYSQKYTDVVTGLVTTDESYKNTGGKGFLLAVGYDFNLGSGFGISPSLVYRNVSYAKQSYTVKTGTSTPYGTTSLQTKALDNELRPMVTLSFRF